MMMLSRMTIVIARSDSDEAIRLRTSRWIASLPLAKMTLGNATAELAG
jgi:hypothetical protein